MNAMATLIARSPKLGRALRMYEEKFLSKKAPLSTLPCHLEVDQLRAEFVRLHFWQRRGAPGVRERRAQLKQRMIELVTEANKK